MDNSNKGFWLSEKYYLKYNLVKNIYFYACLNMQLVFVVM